MTTHYLEVAKRESRMAGALFMTAIIVALLTTAVDTEAADPWWDKWQDPTHATQEQTDIGLALAIALYEVSSD